MAAISALERQSQEIMRHKAAMAELQVSVGGVLWRQARGARGLACACEFARLTRKSGT